MDDDLENDRTLIRRKFIGRAAGGGERILADAKERPFARLDDDDLLDTADICAICGCSARTVYRWIAEGLPIFDKVGRDYLFAKGAFLEWWYEGEEDDDDE